MFSWWPLKLELDSNSITLSVVVYDTNLEPFAFVWVKTFMFVTVQRRNKRYRMTVFSISCLYKDTITIAIADSHSIVVTDDKDIVVY